MVRRNSEAPNPEKVAPDREQLFQDIEAEMGSLVESLRENKFWKEIVEGKFWNKISDEEKTMLYREGDIMNMRELLKRAIVGPLFQVYQKLHFFLKSNNLTVKAFGAEMAPFLRQAVQLNLLTPPQGMSREELVEDISGDTGSAKRLMSFIEYIALCVKPEYAKEIAQVKQVITKILELRQSVSLNEQNLAMAA